MNFDIFEIVMSIWPKCHSFSCCTYDHQHLTIEIREATVSTEKISIANASYDCTISLPMLDYFTNKMQHQIHCSMSKVNKCTLYTASKVYVPICAIVDWNAVDSA
ncbi:unnamed protein product [Spodoptera littoralis]|uniref:Uncharacterized protein n=1 Tax=Spodoptera littoralis TaxID=7109 RepID=A0A9P0III9_SPOLI|nr:unnamed protein product [Spodoptera littoralis]CAH1646552.1 unnamed protein product [Spodoptera littoralis]